MAVQRRDWDWMMKELCGAELLRCGMRGRTCVGVELCVVEVSDDVLDLLDRSIPIRVQHC